MIANFFIVAYVALFIAAFVVTALVRKRQRQDRAPFPENTRLLRGPGESLRKKILELDSETLTVLALGCVRPLFLSVSIVWFSQRTLSAHPTLSFLVGLIMLLGPAVLFIRRLLALIDRRRNTALGAFGERIVAEHLEPLKLTGHRVFHDVPAGDPPAGSTTAPFNLDHVVVGPAGVFAIETKTRRKGRARVGFMAHEIIYDGRALAYPWGEDQHGLEQARRQSEWLAKFLQIQLGRSIPVQALLVFPGWMIIRKGQGPVNVLNPRELPAAIERPPASGHTGFAVPVLDPATIDLVARQLEARCRDVEL